MANNSVVIRIDGDDSGFREELHSTEVSAKAAAAAIAAEYKKTGMSASNAMKKAWAEVKAAQETGSTIVINGVETIIRKNDRLAQSVRKNTADAYGPLASSAEETAGSVIRNLDRIEKKTTDTLSGIRKVDQNARTVFKGLTSATGTAFKGITAATGILSAAWSAAGLSTVQYNANIETLTTSFKTMTGSAEKAAQIVSKLRQLGASTPFETTDLAETSQLLMQYGLSADEAVEKMTMLGDIAQGNTENMQRVAAAYGQMSSAGKVSLEDIKQMIEAGFNPLQEISARTGESMASLYDRISAGTLSVEEITAAMEYATSVGGKFYQSMEQQSQTLNGRISTLKDSAQELAGAIFMPFTDALRTEVLPEAIDILTDLREAYAAGGVDGLIGALERKTPELVSAGVKSVETVLAGVTKKMPMFVRSLVSMTPTILKSSSSLLPLLTDSFFTIFSDIVGQTLEMLPELTPMLVEGLGNVALSVGKGVVKMISSSSNGVVAALKNIGVIGKTAEDVFEEVLTGVDMAGMDDISKTVKANLNVDLTVEDYQAKIDSAVSSIKATLESVPQLSDDERSKIEAALLSGSGLDVFLAILDSLDLPEERKTEIETEISGAVDSIFLGYDVLDTLEREAANHVIGLALVGASAETIKQVLMRYGADEEKAETASSEIVNCASYYLGSFSSISELSSQAVTAASLAALSGESVDSIAAMLVADYDSDPEKANAQAQAIVDSINHYLGSFSSISELSSQAITAASLAALSGESVDSIAAMLVADYDSDPEKANAQAQAIVDCLASYTTALTGTTRLSKKAALASLAALQSGASLQQVADMLTRDYGYSPEQAESLAATVAKMRTAINSAGLLSGALRACVSQLLASGADAEKLENAIISFGIDSETAAAVAASLIGARDTIENAAKEIGIDPTTLTEIVLSARGDHAILTRSLKLLGISDEDIASILASYDTASSSLKAKARGVYQAIATEFTDGMPETDEDVAKAKASVQSLFQEAYDRIGAWRDEKITELNEKGLTGEALTAAVDDIEAEYRSLTTTLNTLEEESLAWTKENAGKSTEFVESNLDQLHNIMAQVETITSQIDVLTNEAFDTARARRTLVQAGAVTSQEHQLEAFALTSAELDERLQEAELRAGEALNQAVEAFSDDAEAYAAKEKEVLDQLAAEKAAAYAKYNEENEKIISGIAKATIAPVYEEEKRLTALAEQLQQAIADAQTAYMLEGIRTDASTLIDGLEASPEDIAKLVEKLGVTPETLTEEIQKSIQAGLDAGIYQGVMQYAGSFDSTIAEALENGDMNVDSAAAVLQQAIQDGYLREGVNGIDWTDAGTLLQTMMGSVGTQGAAGLVDGLTSKESLSDAEDAGEMLVQSAIDSAENTAEVASPSKVFVRIGKYMGDGLVLGLRSTQSKVRAAAMTLANAVADTIRSELDIHSPSRVAIEMGSFTGEGFGIGIEKSMQDVVRRTQRIVGTLNLTPRMHFPDITGAFSTATQMLSENNNVQFAFYVNGQDMGRIMAEDNQRAINARNRSISLGYGKL